MAIKDTTKKPYISDRDELVFIGIDLPFHKSSGVEGWFASTDTTIKAVKNNIKNILLTEKGERLFQLVAYNSSPIKYTIKDNLTDSTRGHGGFGSTGK